MKKVNHWKIRNWLKEIQKEKKKKFEAIPIPGETPLIFILKLKGNLINVVLYNKESKCPGNRWDKYLLKQGGCCCSVALSCLTLFDPRDWSTPGFPVLKHLPELAQTHVHWVSDAIQPSCPCRPFLLLPSIFPSIRVFSNESALHIRWPKYWSFSLSLSPSVMALCSVLSSVLPQQKFEVTDVKALRQTVSQLSDRSVLQLCVTAQFYLENKGKYIIEAWGSANPKDLNRRQRESARMWERESVHDRVQRETVRESEREPWPFGSSFYMFFPPPGPALCKLG